MKLLFGSPQRAHADTKLLSAFLDNQVTAAERTRLEAHLRDCAVCREELHSLRQTITLLRALPRAPTPRAFTLSEIQVGRRRQVARTPWGMELLRGLAGVAAIVLLVAAAATLWRQPVARPAQVARVAATASPAEALLLAEAPSQPVLTAAPPPAAEPRPAAEAEKVVERAAAPVPTRPPAVATPTVVPEKPVEKRLDAAPRAPAPAAALPAASATAPPTPKPAPAATIVPTTEPKLFASTTRAPEPTPFMGAAAVGRGGTGVAADEIGPPEPAPPRARITDTLPAGAGIVYADWRGLWTLDREAGARQLMQSEGLHAAIISPDRASIAYRVLQQDYSAIWVVRWNGRDARRLLAERELPKADLPKGYSERRIQDVQWAGNSRVLALRVIAVPASLQAQPIHELWSLDSETGVHRLITPLAAADQALYAPGGSAIAWLHAGPAPQPRLSLTLLNPDGSVLRPAIPFGAGAEERSEQAALSWLPDGSALWAAIPERSAIAAERLNDLALYRIPIRGELQAFGRPGAFDAFWSPDGRRLAFTRAISDALEIRELFVANADGSRPQPYATLRHGMFINWAPDAAHFLYQDAGQVYLAAAGQTPRRLGNIASVFDPRWIAADQIVHLLDQPEPTSSPAGAGWMLVARDLDGKAVSLWPLPRDAMYDVMHR
jgi:hypothetical protein